MSERERHERLTLLFNLGVDTELARQRLDRLDH